jgi:poly-gamma-glutamate synthesis protein (capsule biosynthesis protein)
MLGRLVNDALGQEAPEHPWGDTLALFRGADWRVCNLECVVADGGTPWTATPKVFHFRSDAKNAAVLRAGGIDAVSLANNHSLDFGHAAMSEMLSVLDRAGVRHAGAGADVAGATRPAFCEVATVRIALIAFTDNEPAWEATPHRGGVFHVPVDLGDARAVRLLELVRRTRSESDLLVVSAHWGPNWGYAPPAGHRPFARALVDAGADVIYGHSGHVVRGIEIYRGRPVLYCTGDFIDDYAVDPVERNDRSLIFVLQTEGGRIRGVRLYPTVIRDFQARLAREAERTAIVATMQRLCADLGTLSCWNPTEGCLEIAVAGGPEPGRRVAS